MPADLATARSLPDILDAVWNEWVIAKDDPAHPLRLGVLATRSQRGVSQRTLVLRDCDRNTRTLMAFTDIRSAKVREIDADPRVSWHFYDPRPKVQIRVEGKIGLHFDDKVADSYWSTAPLANKSSYAGVLPPGTPVDAHTSNRPPKMNDVFDSSSQMGSDAEFLHLGRENFGALVTVVDQIDWLRLDDGGHVRCRFEFESEARVWRQTWLTP